MMANIPFDALLKYKRHNSCQFWNENEFNLNFGLKNCCHTAFWPTVDYGGEPYSCKNQYLLAFTNLLKHAPAMKMFTAWNDLERLYYVWICVQLRADWDYLSMTSVSVTNCWFMSRLDQLDGADAFQAETEISWDTMRHLDIRLGISPTSRTFNSGRITLNPCSRTPTCEMSIQMYRVSSLLGPQDIQDYWEDPKYKYWTWHLTWNMTNTNMKHGSTTHCEKFHAALW